MADKDQITQPSLGSNELGTETNDSKSAGTVSAGTDTQLHIAAKGGKHQKKNINDDEKVVKNENDTNHFLQSDETEE